MMKILLLVCSFLLSCTQPNPINIDLYVEDKSNMADTILTDTPGWAELNVPTPGDPVKAALPDGAVRPGYQKLANRTAAMIRGHKNIVNLYSDDGQNAIIAPLGWVGLTDSTGKWVLIYQGLASVNLTTVSGALAGLTRYYLYAYESAGVLAWQVSTTAPDTEHLYKTGTTTHVFVSTFVTNTLGSVHYYSQIGNVYTLTDDYTAPQDGNAVLVAGASFFQVNVPFNHTVPDGFTVVTLGVRQITAAIPGDVLHIGNNSFVAGTETLIQQPWGPGTYVDHAILTRTPTIPIGSFDYKITGGTVDVWIKGFVY